MKLLLTSNGLSNESIANALEQLVGKPRKETKIAFIPTAAFAADYAEQQTKDWLANDLYRINEFAGFIDVISLADLTPEDMLKRLEYADVIFIGGGNTFYLSYSLEKTGLFDKLPELLKTRVYAGISAGSMIATKSIRTASQAIKNPGRFYDEEYDEMGPKGRSAGRAAGLVDFVVRPHYGRVRFPGDPDEVFGAIVSELGVPLYAIDDQSAVKVIDGKVEVVSEGAWKLFS
jgi:dipeptidase E